MNFKKINSELRHQGYRRGTQPCSFQGANPPRVTSLHFTFASWDGGCFKDALQTLVMNFPPASRAAPPGHALSRGKRSRGGSAGPNRSPQGPAQQPGFVCGLGVHGRSRRRAQQTRRSRRRRERSSAKAASGLSQQGLRSDSDPVPTPTPAFL